MYILTFQINLYPSINMQVTCQISTHVLVIVLASIVINYTKSHSTTCKEMEDKICLYYDPITKMLKQNPKLKKNAKQYTNDLTYHVKKIHQKDHHHRLDKYIAYQISVIALKRLEESSKILKLPFYFPRIIKEINNLTYHIEHVGLQSDQIDIQIDEKLIEKQVKDMRRILEFAGVIHLDFEPHCKNIVYNEKTKRISLIDFDIVAIKAMPIVAVADDVKIKGAKPIWVDEGWYPNIYEDRFLDMRGWDNVEQRMYSAFKECLNPTCFCRAKF